MASPTPVRLSVVIPLLNEAGNIGPLLDEIVTVLNGYPATSGHYEIICVDDGSTDQTAVEILECQNRYSMVRLIHHDASLGMSPAIRTGVRAAYAPWIVTLDGDRQNDPHDIPRLLERAWVNDQTTRVMIAGIRIYRQDTLAKKLASRSANFIRRFVLEDDCPDTGCSLKLFPKTSYLQLPFFSGLHRFMPALMKHYGHTIEFIPVCDRPRLHGQSKSDIWGRAIRGLFDLIGVLWLIRRTPVPTEGHEMSQALTSSVIDFKRPHNIR